MFPCMDDLIIPAQTEDEALEKQKVLKTAGDYGLNLNLKKCKFLYRHIEFLGHVIENGTLSPNTTKTLAVERFPEPTNLKQVQSFLGLTGYFRKYIRNYSLIAKPFLQRRI